MKLREARTYYPVLLYSMQAVASECALLLWAWWSCEIVSMVLLRAVSMCSGQVQGGAAMRGVAGGHVIFVWPAVVVRRSALPARWSGHIQHMTHNSVARPEIALLAGYINMQKSS